MTASRFEQAMGDLRTTPVRIVAGCDLGRGDHGGVAVGPSGLYVVHIESDRGTIEVRRDGWFAERHDRLYVGPWERNEWLTAVAAAAAGVGDHLADGSIPVHPVIATVDIEWPWRPRGYLVNGVHVVALPAVRKLLVRPGPFAPDAIEVLATGLAAAYAR
jgi:hypothetical protein